MLRLPDFWAVCGAGKGLMLLAAQPKIQQQSCIRVNQQSLHNELISLTAAILEAVAGAEHSLSPFLHISY